MNHMAIFLKRAYIISNSGVQGVTSKLTNGILTLWKQEEIDFL